jgi:HEAT repeat protein
LGRIGDTRAIEPLIEGFRANHVSFSALQALGQIGSPHAEAFLKSIVQNSHRSTDVVIARKALKDINIGRQHNDSHYLQSLINTTRGQRRRWIVELLARNGQIEAIEILAKLLGDDSEDAEIRGIAAAGLVLRGHNSFTLLHKLAASQSRQTHDLAQAAIVRIGMNTTTRCCDQYHSSFFLLARKSCILS